MIQTSGMKEMPQTFWDRLEEASRDVGLPCGLSDIGRELDLWPSAVQKWKDEINYPGTKNLIALAKNRGVSTEWLKTGRGPKFTEEGMDANTREMMKIWNSLSTEAQERLLKAAHYEKSINPAPLLPPPRARLLPAPKAPIRR